MGNNKKYKLGPVYAWLINTKFEGKPIIDYLDNKKLNTCLICDKEDIAKIGTDKKEIVTCFNNVFIILKKPLSVELKPDDKIEIKRIWKQYAKRRAANTKLDSTITEGYKNVIIQAYRDRYIQVMANDVPPSLTSMEDGVGRGISEGHDNEMPKKKKNDIRKGFADMMGTRFASTAPN